MKAKFTQRDVVISRSKNKEQENDYYNFLSQQSQEKRNKRLAEIEADRRFVSTERDQMTVQHNNRLKYFEKLKGYQLANDEKNKMLQKYMAQDEVQLNTKKDEKAYLKAIQEESKKAQEKDRKNKLTFIKRKQENFDILDRQMKEKEQERLNKQHQEQEIGRQLLEQANKEIREMEEKRKQDKLRQREYFKSLADQIHFNNKMKTYSVLMTEYERAVNENDIKAYENVDTNHLHSLVPGFNSYNQQEEYIDKSMNLANSTNIKIGRAHKDPILGDNNASNTQDSAQAGNPKVGILDYKMNKHKSVNHIGYSPNKLQNVMKKMDEADSYNFRASTINKSYGNLNMII